MYFTLLLETGFLLTQRKRVSSLSSNLKNPSEGFWLACLLGNGGEQRGMIESPHQNHFLDAKRSSFPLEEYAGHTKQWMAITQIIGFYL